MTTTVVLHSLGYGHKGLRYRVTLDGVEIATDTTDPEHAAARALLALGITGSFETHYEDGRAGMCFGDIEETAKWMVVDHHKTGLATVPWTSFPTSLFDRQRVIPAGELPMSHIVFDLLQPPPATYRLEDLI